MTDTTAANPPQETEDTVIFCTRSCHAIDYVPSGQDPQHRLQQHMAQYGPDLVLLSPEEALLRYEAKFISPAEDITEERFHDMLNVLPPVAWTHAGGGESFRVSECLAGRVQAHFVRLGKRYATFADLPTPHDECCRRAAALFSTPPSQT